MQSITSHNNIKSFLKIKHKKDAHLPFQYHVLSELPSLHRKSTKNPKQK